MKFVLAMLILFTTQPLPAEVCDMQGELPMPHDMAMVMAADRLQGMDCCDETMPSTPDSCLSMPDCGTCANGLAVIHPFSLKLHYPVRGRMSLDNDQAPQGTNYSPPFRPPIA